LRKKLNPFRKLVDVVDQFVLHLSPSTIHTVITGAGGNAKP